MIYLDIETLPPLDWSDEQIDAYVRERVPGTFKKPESIAQWCEENRQEVFARAALDWRVSRIACLCAIYDDGREQHEFHGFGGVKASDERVLMHTFEHWISRIGAYGSKVCGHNILGFDIPRLHLAAAREQMSFASWFAGLSTHRGLVVDTMHLAFPTRERVSLADLAASLGLGGKSGHGSDVLKWWLEGKHGHIAVYCMDDVKLTRDVYRSLMGADRHSPFERAPIDRLQVASLIDAGMRRDGAE